jgi:ABC-type nitrate/sulfonate/bicarbonate transport system substrate-binding protein
MSATASHDPVEIVFTRCGGATASTVAIQKGWLAEEFNRPGTRLSSLRDNPEIRESHFDHSVRAMFREGGNIPPIWARAKGADTVVLGITWVDEYQSVVVRADSSVRDLSDLKGKRLAVPLYRGISIDFQRGAALHGFANALSLAGLVGGDVEFVDILIEQGGEARPNGAAQLEALDRGEVDAVFLRQASGVQLARRYGDQLRQLVKLTDEPDPLKRVNNGTPRPITAHREFLAAHPDLVVRYLAVLLRAGAWAEANPNEAVSAIAAEDGGVGEEIARAAFPDLARSLLPALTRNYVDGLEAQKNFLREWGFLAGDFEIREWIEDGPLEEARALVRRERRFAA